MLDPTRKIAIYAEATMGLLNAKMAEGILRYGRNPVVAVIDSKAAGKTVGDLCRMTSDVPVVAALEDALSMGAEILVLGTAPSGGRVPEVSLADGYWSVLVGEAAEESARSGQAIDLSGRGA